MQLTESWRDMFPQSVLDRYEFRETRNASRVMHTLEPKAFDDLVEVLDGFWLTMDKLTTPGGNKTVIAAELDDLFRVRGWREGQYDQDLITRLTLTPWPTGQERHKVIETSNSYGGHKIDNVLGRAAVDVEWNPKDGNLDRDLNNFVNLYEGGVIDTGVILTRVADDLRYFVRDLIAETKAVQVPEHCTAWRERMRKLSKDPMGTSTTSNFGKLVPRLERGDGRGCPILAIAITKKCYVPPTGTLDAEVRRLAAAM
ncbi:hypothetical protein nbrc107696_18790 [Gordonia spumicola]|uniref:Restriction endonuclease n=1 Tax=Gordonia spumicola TaxID=589161 RepID=A0A7I9V8L3_9ACTN|nr:BglII/BstYI family type II restriction endonuclease [Gordonia spumicola]GEE01433.1 hypothetical protein nbrc107696_18790 [Gordonia spumicola]